MTGIKRALEFDTKHDSKRGGKRIFENICNKNKKYLKILYFFAKLKYSNPSLSANNPFQKMFALSEFALSECSVIK